MDIGSYFVIKHGNGSQLAYVLGETPSGKLQIVRCGAWRSDGAYWHDHHSSIHHDDPRIGKVVERPPHIGEPPSLDALRLEARARRAANKASKAVREERGPKVRELYDVWQQRWEESKPQYRVYCEWPEYVAWRAADRAMHDDARSAAREAYAKVKEQG